ncbi:ABC transporter substrate-binding protein [Amycolatopsis taiwanensis]|uniref:Sugar ABC transporter substrate-binding protein n=1 Tax=Amycolatopsis taiwanensis TaxID=342230 RepID=A0A9W6RBH4_9PSEU|nr:sugar ABC transporter substrate-binding protein [Amycolatopsis taiwanensis]GLY71700.1 sugar ABC transporter substrate-binding protein [Amycolatopsis taiwanensis]
MRKQRPLVQGGLNGLLQVSVSRRGVLAGAGGIGLAAALAACGGSGGSGKNGSLTIWASNSFAANNSSALAKAGNDFGAANDVAMTVQGFGANDLINKITTTLSGGGGPDIVIVDSSQVAQLGDAKLLVDLTDRVTPIKDQFFAGNVAAATSKGVTYGVPFDTSNVALFWNKKMFEKAGIANPPTTWDELRSVAKELTGGDKYGYMLGAKGYGSFLFWPWLWQNGGKVTNEDYTKATFNDAAGQEAWEFYSGLHLKDKVVPPTFLGVTDSWDQFEQPFITEQVAMMAAGDFAVAPLKKGNPGLEYAVAPLPKKINAATVQGGNVVSVTKAAKNVDLAWKFVSWLTSAEQEKVLQDGYQRLPARTDVTGSAFATSDQARSVFVSQAAFAQPRPPVPQWGSIEWGVMADAWDSVVQGKSSPADALNNAATAATGKLTGN